VSAESILIIGVGNPDRGDDAAGREAARRLRRTDCARHAEILDLDGEATALLATFERAETVFLVDACVSGAPPGAIRRFDVEQTPLSPAHFGLSSHGFGLGEALELARMLGALPRRCVVYAIEGDRFDHGAPLTEAVACAVDEVVERLRREVGAHFSARGGAHA
jgi:hydrogenase maturation protease